MDLPDADLVDALQRRDGPQSYKGHLDEAGRCRYAYAYHESAACPWCEAVDRKITSRT